MAEIEKETSGVENTEAREPAVAAKEQTDAPKKSKKLGAAQRKKFKYGALATAITCIVVAVVVVLNVLVNVLVEKYPVKLDLTEKAMFEISDQTIDYVKALDQDVNFTVLMDESSFQVGSSYMKMISEILERYTQYSDKITLHYVNPTNSPDVVNRYQEYYSGSLKEGDVVISNAADDSKLRVVNIDNMFQYDQEAYYYYRYYGVGTIDDCIKSFSGEQDLTAALMYVTDANPVSVAFVTTANGEPIYNQQFNAASVAMISATLSKNGYDLHEVDIYTDKLDTAEYDMIVLPAPVNDLSDTVIDNISAFLYNDGKYEKNMLYIADYTQSATPKLDALLESWGVRVTRNIAYESNPDAAQQVRLAISANTTAVPVATLAESDYSADLSNPSLPIVAPLCRPIEFLWDSQSGGINKALLKTSDTVYLGEMGKSTGDADKTPAGSQIVMAISRRSNMEDNVQYSSNIMVAGSSLLFDYMVMQDAAYNNAEYMMSAVNKMNNKGSGLIIASKDMTNETITVTQGQIGGITIFLFAIPAAIAAAGIAVFVRRRNR